MSNTLKGGPRVYPCRIYEEKEAICLVDIACSGTKHARGVLVRSCGVVIRQSQRTPTARPILVWGRTGRVVLELQGSFSLHFNVPDAESYFLGPSWTFPGPPKAKRDDHGMK